MLPEKFAQRMESLLQDEYQSFVDSLEREPEKGLRVNTLKISKEDFLAICPFSLSTTPFSPYGYVLADGEKAGAGRHPYHAAGLYYMQEPSAMTAAEALCAKSGECVLDLCAAPGGKSTRLACAVGEEGLLVSNEIVRSRAKILASNLERMGAKNSVVTSAEPEELCTALEGFFDRVLVDAPCSGEGMFRKNSDAAVCWSPEHVVSCADRQMAILRSAAKALKAGGTMVYSTCTFSPEENEGVVCRFLAEHPDFELQEITQFPHTEGIARYGDGRTPVEKCARLFPHLHRGEGHFVAKLIRKGDEIHTHFLPPKEADKKIKALWEELMDEVLKERPFGRLTQQGDYLFLCPEKMPALPTKMLLWPGVQTAVIKKNRLEPCHHLFTSAKESDLCQSLSYEAGSKEIFAFLRGETLETDKKGYVGILVDGYTLGFGKASGGQLKNWYPKGLRLQKQKIFDKIFCV